MSGKRLTAEQRLELIRRVADWVYDRTESWAPDRIGLGLSYLLWAIAADDGQPFDTTIGPKDEYAELVRILKANPNGLWDQLVAIGAIV